MKDLKRLKECVPFLSKRLLPNLYNFTLLEQQLNFRPCMLPSRFKTINRPDKQWPLGGWLSENTWPPSLIQEEIQTGVIYIKDCSRITKEMNNVCKEIEEVTNWPTDVHIFCSLSSTLDKSGFLRHNDNQHNLIVAQEGRLQVKVWQEDKCIIDEICENGDAVYVPKNTDHQVVPLDKRVSLSFSMADYETFFQEREWIDLNV